VEAVGLEFRELWTHSKHRDQRYTVGGVQPVLGNVRIRRQKRGRHGKKVTTMRKASVNVRKSQGIQKGGARCVKGEKKYSRNGGHVSPGENRKRGRIKCSGKGDGSEDTGRPSVD